MPILRGPNWGLTFYIHTDALDYVISVVLGQKVDSIEHVIYFINKNLQGAESNYTVTEKEVLAVIYVLNKFKHYIIGYEIFFHTNHSAIKYLVNKTTISGKLARWLLLVQIFNITIVDKLGKANVLANFLSKLHLPNNPTTIDDSFPNEHLFPLVTQNPLYVDLLITLPQEKC